MKQNLILKGNNKEVHVTKSPTCDKGKFDYWITTYYYSNVFGGFWHVKDSDKMKHATSFTQAVTIAKNQIK